MAKVAVFRLNNDPDQFASLQLKAGTDATYKKLQGLAPIGKSWKGLPVNEDNSTSKQLGDFPSLFPGCSPAVSERALSVLEPLISDFVEVLPLGSFSGLTYFVIHVLKEIDALDKEKSKYLIVDGVKASVTRFAFHEELLGAHIFRLPELRHRQPLVSKEFKQCVEKHKLMGALFRKIS